MANKKWSELTSGQRTAIVSMSAVELMMTGVALVDLYRRPAFQVRGPKPLWAVVCLIQPVGPIAYLVAGRRRHADAVDD